jgi:glucosylceramidase
MVLDTQGGPNWFKNWCVAPVIVDPEKDEVYFTPLYYTLSHFSKYIRPEAVVIGLDISDKNLMATAAKNPDGSIAVVLFNEGKETKNINLKLSGKSITIQISGQAIQTIVIPNENTITN